MKSERNWFPLVTGLAFGAMLGLLLYTRISKNRKLAVSDPRIDQIRSLIDEADQLLKRSRKKK